MKIHCDHCGHELEEHEALVHEAEPGELFYFCNEECLRRCRHLTPVELPGPEDRGTGSTVPVTDDA